MAAGETLTVVDMEQHHAEQWAAMLVILEDVVENPAEASSGMLQEKNTNKFSITELMQQAQDYSSFCAPKFIVAPLTKASVDLVCARFTEMRNSYKWHLLCNKWPDQNHVTSNEHHRRMHDMAAGDEQIGTCVSRRGCEDSPGFRCRMLITQGFRSVWGWKSTICLPF